MESIDGIPAKPTEGTSAKQSQGTPTKPTEDAPFKPTESTPVKQIEGASAGSTGVSPPKLIKNSPAKPAETTSIKPMEITSETTDSTKDASPVQTKLSEDTPTNLAELNTDIIPSAATISDITTEDVFTNNVTNDHVATSNATTNNANAHSATSRNVIPETKDSTEVTTDNLQGLTSDVQSNAADSVKDTLAKPSDDGPVNQKRPKKFLPSITMEFLDSLSTNPTEPNRNEATDTTPQVADLMQQLAAMTADRDTAVQRAQNRYQKMRLAENDSKNYLKAGKLEVASRLELQTKYDKLMFLLDCRDNSITDLQNQLAHAQQHIKTLQSSSVNQKTLEASQQALEATYQERLAAAKKEAENAALARFAPQLKEFQTMTAASKKKLNENEQKIAALEKQLCDANTANEEYKLKIQQQAAQQSQRHQAKRKFDAEMLQSETGSRDRTMIGWRSPSIPTEAPSTPVLDVPDKRQKISTPGNGITRGPGTPGRRTPYTPSRKQLHEFQQHLVTQFSPSQLPLAIDEFGVVVNAQLQNLGQPTVGPLEVARRYNAYMAFNGEAVQSSPSIHHNIPSAGQRMPSGSTGGEMQEQTPTGVKRRNSSVEAQNALPAAKKLKPSPMPPLPHGGMDPSLSSGQAARPRTQGSVHGYQHKLKSIDEQTTLQSFSPYNKSQSHAPLSAGEMNALSQVTQNQNQIKMLQKQQKPSNNLPGNNSFGSYSNPAPQAQAQSFSSQQEDYDDLYSLDFKIPPKRPTTLAPTKTNPGAQKSIERTNNPSEIPDYFDIKNLDLSYDVNNPDSFGIASTEPADPPQQQQQQQQQQPVGRVTRSRSRSRSAAPQQTPQNTPFPPVNPAYILSSNAPTYAPTYAPAYAPASSQAGRARSSTAERTTRARSAAASASAASSALVPVCLSCHLNWWNSTCDESAACQNCILSHTRCERIRCLSYDAGTCTDAKCRRVHEGHAYPSVVERPKTLKRSGKKGDSVPSPVERLGAGSGGG